MDYRFGNTFTLQEQEVIRQSLLTQKETLTRLIEDDAADLPYIIINAAKSQANIICGLLEYDWLYPNG